MKGSWFWASVALNQYDQFHMLDGLCSGGWPRDQSHPGELQGCGGAGNDRTGSDMVVGPLGPLISLICFTCLLVGCYTVSSKHNELKAQ